MTLKISAKWIIVGLFLFLEGIMVTIYNFHGERDRATIAFTATVLGGAFALYTYLQGIDERRTHSAHHLMERWNSADMVEIRRVLEDVIEGKIAPATLIRHTQDIQEKRLSLVTALNFFEEVAIATLKKTANEERLKDFFSAIVQQSFAKLEDWIKNERRVDNEPKYYSEFEKLAARWKNDA